MYRTHTCGELRLANVNETVCLSGWVQKIRNLGAMTFIDLRDRYGITQLVVEESATEEIRQQVAALGREFVIQVTGKVVERSSKNNKIPTGEIEILIAGINVLSRSEIPPFTIEEHTDGGDESTAIWICGAPWCGRTWNCGIAWRIWCAIIWIPTILWRWKPPC